MVRPNHMQIRYEQRAYVLQSTLCSLGGATYVAATWRRVSGDGDNIAVRTPARPKRRAATG
eukprot:7499574-Pyramimonas_sp.AAC.1